MKNVLWLVVIVVLVSSCAATPSVPKPTSDEVGAVVGKLTVMLDKRWKLIPAGMHLTGIIVKLENIETHKVHTAPVKDGWYAFLNLPPGNYVLTEWKIEKASASESWYLFGNITEIYLDVRAGAFSVVKNLEAYVTVLPNDKFRFHVLPKQTNEEELRGLFTTYDKDGLWESFTW